MKKKSLGRVPLYEDKDKIAIGREYLTGGLGYTELGKKYGLGRETVRHFVRWYQKHCEQGTPGHSEPGAADRIGPVGSPGSLPTSAGQNTDKDKQLQEAHLKIAALEMLIANAQKELGIDLIKKPGTKPSNK